MKFKDISNKNQLILPILVISGGGIGHQINNLLLPSIRNVADILRELGTDRSPYVICITPC